jgi:hypothetical protein
MTPVEEQILRNQTAILGMLNNIMPVSEDSLKKSIQRAAMCIKETCLLLEAESAQGSTVHAYPA